MAFSKILMFCLVFLAIPFFSCQQKQVEKPIELTEETIEFKSSSPSFSDSDRAKFSYPFVRSIPEEDRREAVNALLNSEGLFKVTLTELSNAFASNEYPFDYISYEVLYNNKSILQVRYKIKSTGIYSSLATKIINIDIRKATTFGPESMFQDDLVIAKHVDKLLRTKIEKETTELATTAESDSDAIKELVMDKTYSSDMLFNAEITDQGIIFVFTFELPHAFKELEPVPITQLITWKELKPFMYEGCILERFIQ